MKSNLHTMKSMPPVTEDEITRHMNFDELLTMRAVHKQRVLRRNYFALALLTTSLAVLSWWMFKTSSLPDLPANESAPSSLTAPDSTVTQSIHEGPVIQVIPKATGETKPTPSKIQKELNAKDSVPAVAANEYIEAEPVHGYPDLYEYFNRELRYPDAVLKDSIQGTESVSFIIGKDGKPINVTILHSLGEPFDQESIRLISNMPAWRPAQLNGTPVRAKLTMPLTFTINTKTTHP